jgi:hypothetical protein
VRHNSYENQPNEEDDTNESSRLLVNVSRNSNNNSTTDNQDAASQLTVINESASATETGVESGHNPQTSATIDLISLDNQMTTSEESKRNLKASTSRYGSIDSINLILSDNSIQKVASSLSDATQTAAISLKESSSRALKNSKSNEKGYLNQSYNNDIENYDGDYDEETDETNYENENEYQDANEESLSSKKNSKSTPGFYTPHSFTESEQSMASVATDMGSSPASFSLNKNTDKQFKLKTISKKETATRGSDAKVNEKKNKELPLTNKTKASNSKKSTNAQPINKKNLSKIVSRLEAKTKKQENEQLVNIDQVQVLDLEKQQQLSELSSSADNFVSFKESDMNSIIINSRAGEDQSYSDEVNKENLKSGDIV